MKLILRCQNETTMNEAVLVPVHHLSLPLSCDHVQQRLPEVVSDAAITNHLVPKDDKTQVVDVLYVVLLNIHPVLQHKQRQGVNVQYNIGAQRSCVSWWNMDLFFIMKHSLVHINCSLVSFSWRFNHMVCLVSVLHPDPASSLIYFDITTDMLIRSDVSGRHLHFRSVLLISWCYKGNTLHETNTADMMEAWPSSIWDIQCGAF